MKMETGRLINLRADMEKCFRCSLCKMVPLPVALSPEFTDACPPSRRYHFHGYSGSGKQIMALALLDGRIQADQDLADIVYACHACGYCDVACKFIMDAERHQVNMALRELLAAEGLAPAPLKKAMENLQRHGHASDQPKRSPGAWAEGLGLKVLPANSAEVLLLAGCTQRDDDPSAATARKLARLLRHAGVDVGILGDEEPCCGLPAYWAGYRDLYASKAQANAALLEGSGARQVVVASGSCLGSLRSKYGEYARQPGIEILHATEVLAQLIAAGKLRLSKPVKQKVTYHDPCYLGRQSEPFSAWKGVEKTTLGVMTYRDPPKKINYGVNGVYDPPRAILQAIPGLEFKEMHRVREYSYCCGGGGGVPLSDPELARAAASHRIEEARGVGADLMVTACARCEVQFRNVPSGLPVADVIDLVFQAAGLEE
jgi:Fe-S oxidoreductase